MPIRPAARHEIEEIGERLEALDVFSRMAGMPYLQAVQPRRDQRLEPLAPAAIARVRPDRQSAGLVHDPNRVLDREVLFRNERRPRAAEISRERIPKILHDAASNQRTRHMRTSNRAAVGLQQDFVQREWNAERVELFYNLLRAGVPHGAQLAETPLQSFEMGEMQRQKMDFVLFVKCAELYSGNYSNTQPHAGGARRWNAIDRVVIGKCQGSEAAALRGLDYSVGRDGTVRSGRMRMEIDERGPARIRTHRS